MKTIKLELSDEQFEAVLRAIRACKTQVAETIDQTHDRLILAQCENEHEEWTALDYALNTQKLWREYELGIAE